MELSILDDDFLQSLDFCLETGSWSELFESLDEENSRDKLIAIFLKINQDITFWSHNLSSTASLVKNALSILQKLIQHYGIFNENICICISKTALSLVIDEDCSIKIMKEAIILLNLLIKNPTIKFAVISDDSLEGSLQIFGRKLASIGDYECQALLYEALFRIACDENREFWAHAWFSDKDPRTTQFYLNLDPHKFESNCRKALNYINRNEAQRRVFSVIANSIFFGSFELKQSLNEALWVDFNYGSESISFYCLEMSIDDSLNESELWETIVIPRENVNAFYIRENTIAKVNEVTLILNCPCSSLITSSSITNDAFSSFHLKLTFWAILQDIQMHLEIIYGKEKFIKTPSSEILSVFNCSGAVKVKTAENEPINAKMLLDEILPNRKISHSSPIPIETENLLPVVENVPILARMSESSEVIEIKPQDIMHNAERAGILRISESSEVIEIEPEEEQRALENYEIHLAPNVYDSEVIPLTPLTEAFQSTNAFQEHSGNVPKRKVSCSSSIKLYKDIYEFGYDENDPIENGLVKNCLKENGFVENGLIDNSLIENGHDENGHDEDGYEYQVIKSSEKQKKELTTYQTKKVSVSPLKSTSLENNRIDVLMNDMIEKTGIVAETQSNSKYGTNKFIEKSPMSSVVDFDNIGIEYPNKNSISEENVNSYSRKVFDRKEFIHTLDKNKAEEQDEKNSETSDVFADVSAIDDSQATKHKLIGNLEHHQESNVNILSSEIAGLPTVSKEREMKRKSSMASDVDNESSITYEAFRKSPKGSTDSETASEKQLKKIHLSHEELDKFSKRTSNSQTVPEKPPKKIRLSQEEFGDFSKTTSDSQTVFKKQPRTSRLSQEEFGDSFETASNSQTVLKKQPKTSRLSDEQLGESSKRVSDSETIPETQPKKICLSHKELGQSSKRISDSDSVPEKQSTNIHLSLEELSESSKEARNSTTFCEKQTRNDRVSHEESGESSERISSSQTVDQKKSKEVSLSPEESSKGASGSETVHKKQPRKKRLSHKELGEFSEGTSKAETVKKKQKRKTRLYNLENAPVYDVPPSKVSNKNANPEVHQIEHDVNDLNEDIQDESGDNIEPTSVKRNDSNVVKKGNKRVSKAEKMKIYDINHIHESDDDFDANNFRDFSSNKKRPKTLSSYGARSSKKKKNEASQTDTLTKKSPRPTRKAAVNAMKVNKRILDQASEVACDEIQVLNEADDSSKSPTNRPVKRRKYSKVFSNVHTDTETGSSEASWLKQKKLPLFESPKKTFSSWKKNQLRKKNLQVQAESIPKKPQKKRKNVYHNVNVDSESKQMTWSDFQSFNLTVEKRKSNSYSFLNDLENDMQSLVTPTHNRSVNNETEDLSPNQRVQGSSLNGNVESIDGSSENDLHEEYNDQNIDYDNPCDNIEDKITNNRGNCEDTDKSDSYKGAHEIKRNKQKHASINNIASDECDYIQDNSKGGHNYKHNTDKSDYYKGLHATKRNRKKIYHPNSLISSDEYDKKKYNNDKGRHNYKNKNDKSIYHKGVRRIIRKVNLDSIIPPAEFNSSLQKQIGSQSDQSILFEGEFAADEKTTRTVRNFQKEKEGKQLLLQKFLECALKCSESSIEARMSFSLPNIDLGSKGNSAKNHKAANKKNRRAKTSESSTSWNRKKDEEFQPFVNDLKNLEHLKKCSLDDLSLRNSIDSVRLENISSVEYSDKIKRKKISSDSRQETPERPYKRIKLHDNISDLENCTLDPLSVRHSSGPVSAKRVSKTMGNRTSGCNTTRQNLDSGFEELYRSGNLAEKTKHKHGSSNILDNTLHSQVTSMSLKEVESDRKWFRKITFTLSKDADGLTRKLLATVQKCYFEYSAKMCLLREKILKVTEIFENSATQNINSSKVKKLIQTCGVVRAEVEKSLKSMRKTGEEYFETEEKHYQKYRHKYIKASKKFLSSMQNAKNNAFHKLEGNVLLKTKYVLRKFMKYIDVA